jgi:hypothetical protein
MSEILFLSRIAVTVGEQGREIIKMQGTYSNVQVS